MAKAITKQQILDLVKGKSFATEDELRDYLIPQLAILFKVSESQVDKEPITTSFDRTLSNRADIIIRTDGDILKKAFIVFELKLSKSVDKFKGVDYGDTGKQLKKYCQDTRAPYGVLLTEDFCAIFRNKYFSYDQEPKRVEKGEIPAIKDIENTMAREALLDFIMLDKSVKYIFLLILGSVLLQIFVGIIKIIFKLSFVNTILFSLFIGAVLGVVLWIIIRIRKTFD